MSSSINSPAASNPTKNTNTSQTTALLLKKAEKMPLQWSREPSDSLLQNFFSSDPHSTISLKKDPRQPQQNIYLRPKDISEQGDVRQLEKRRRSKEFVLSQLSHYEDRLKTENDNSIRRSVSSQSALDTRDRTVTTSHLYHRYPSAIADVDDDVFSSVSNEDVRSRESSDTQAREASDTQAREASVRRAQESSDSRPPRGDSTSKRQSRKSVILSETMLPFFDAPTYDGPIRRSNSMPSVSMLRDFSAAGSTASSSVASELEAKGGRKQSEVLYLSYSESLGADYRPIEF